MYKESGINRLSIGLQSTNNKVLKEIGRIHSYEQFLETYKLAREIGFDNINVDLMLGLQNQNIDEEISNILEIAPEHISVYSLIVEENTPLHKLVENKQYILPSEEIERQMYWQVKRRLEENVYKHYEISNFAKSGFESKHNLDCWNQKEYIGFGVASHSYTDNCRYSTITDIKQYIENFEKNKLEDNIIIEEVQDKTLQAKEFILLSLRTIKGCSIEEFYNKFGYDLEKGFAQELEKLVNNGLIVIENGYIHLSNKGIDLANIVWQEFV